MIIFSVENIGVTSTGKVKLLDLDTLCKKGDKVQPCGSPGYAAPEIITASREENGKIEAHPSQDVFSFGRTIEKGKECITTSSVTFFLFSKISCLKSSR